MRTVKLKPKVVKEKIAKLLRILADKAFLVSLGLLAFALIFGGLIFYQYAILAPKTEPPLSEEPFQFQEKTYRKVLEIWQEREERFEQAGSKEYPNPFNID